MGWSDGNFIYTVAKSGSPLWQPGLTALKSYDAANKQLLTLDKASGNGSNDSDYTREVYGNVYEIGKKIIYEKSWNNAYGNDAAINDKHAGIYSIDATGRNSQTLKTFDYLAGTSTYFSSVPYQGDQVYYQVTEKNILAYFAYQNGKVSPRGDIADEYSEYSRGSVTYLLSPAGSEAFWAEPRDGKNTLLLGDSNGHSGKQIATLSEYSSYGWFTDDYLLASKGGSELYIMPKGGASGGNKTVKISDYHKPAQSFRGYGGGYGGL